MSMMEQEALPQLNPALYVSTFEAEALLEDLPFDFSDFDLTFTTPSSDMSFPLDAYLPASGEPSLAPFTPPSSDTSFTIDPRLLTSSASSPHSSEANSEFLSFDAEQALLGLEGSETLFSAVPTTIPPNFDIPEQAVPGLEDHQSPFPSVSISISGPASQQSTPSTPHLTTDATVAPPPTSSPHPPRAPLLCPHPRCASRPTRTHFSRPCDLRKHFRRHTKHLFCRHASCPAATSGGFSSKKDRARHEASHSPGVQCEWEGCGRVFSRRDNMRDHLRRVHGGSGKGEEGKRERGERGK